MASDVVTVAEQEGHHLNTKSTDLQSSPRFGACVVKSEDWHSEDEISVGCPSPSTTDELCHPKATGEPEYYRPLKKLKMMHLTSQEESLVTPVKASEPKVIRPLPVNLTTKEPTNQASKAGVKSFSIMDILSYSKTEATQEEPPFTVTKPKLKESKSSKNMDAEEKDGSMASIVRPWDTALPSTGNLPFPGLFCNPTMVPHSAFALQSHFHTMAMAHHVRFLPFHQHAVPLAAVHHPRLSPSSAGRASSSSPYSETDVDVDELSSSTSDSPALPGLSGTSAGKHAGNRHGKPAQTGKKPGQGANGSPLDALFQMTSKTFDGPHGGPEGSGNGNHANLFSNRQATKKKRKSRTAFSNHQIYELEKRFLYQKYLSPADRDEIALSLGLTNAQVITWFQNRRAKLKRDVEELKKDVESAKILGPHRHHHPGPAHGPHGGLLAPGSVAEMTLLQQKADEYQQALQAANGE